MILQDLQDSQAEQTLAMQDDQLTHRIIGCAMKVHRSLGHGFLESVYQKALAHELHKNGLLAECETPIHVSYDGIEAGVFYADILVNSRVIVEIKAVEQLVATHEAQLVNYLTATEHDIGLLFNFGSSSLQYKRKFRTYRNPAPHPVNPEQSS